MKDNAHNKEKKQSFLGKTTIDFFWGLKFSILVCVCKFKSIYKICASKLICLIVSVENLKYVFPSLAFR